MAIVKMKKITLVAPKNIKDGLLSLVQDEGSIHLVDLGETLKDIDGIECFKESKSVTKTEMDYNNIKFTYEFLKQYTDKKDGLLSRKEVIGKEEFNALAEDTDWKSIYEQCREIEDGINFCKSERNKTKSSMDQYEQWLDLDVSEEELSQLKKSTYYIGTVAAKYEAGLYEELKSSFVDIHIERISERQQDVNLFILSHMDDEQGVLDILKRYGFSKANLDLQKKPISIIDELDRYIHKLDSEMEEYESRGKELSKTLQQIKRIYDYIIVNLDKEKSAASLLKTRKTIILQGWMKESDAQGFSSLAEKRFRDVFINIEDPGEDETPPIALKNNAFVEPFEVITSMYSLPLPTEIDPTPVIAPFFMLFFGMMMADIGYGIVMAVAAFLALRLVELGEDARKMMKLILYCSVPTIIFGFLYGSFFGGIIKVTPIWVDPVSKPMDVLIVSMVLGLIHLFTGLGVKGYQMLKAHKYLDAIFDVLLWYVLIIGLVMLFTIGGKLASILSIVGALGLLATQGRSNETIVGKFFGGLYGLYGITGYLGDTLSYSRLLALGLATGLIGWSFNLLIGLMTGPIVYVVGPIIFIAGHTFNFLIGALGTFVHTSRLQYLEFFGKFYEGGGRAYTPLRINTKFINIKREK